MNNPATPAGTPIHDWFGLTYSSYLVLPRSVLQSAPIELQGRLVAILEELEALFGELPSSSYWVRAKEGNRFVHDPLKDYERGRRVIPFKSQEEPTQ